MGTLQPNLPKHCGWMSALQRCLALALLLTPVVAAEWYGESRELYYGIPVSVRFTPTDPELAVRIWKALEAIDNEFNDYRDDSEIGRINAGGPGEYKLSPGLAEAFVLSGRMREATAGACEITVGSLRRLWKGAAKTGRWPTDAEIAAARAATGPSTYRLEGDRLRVLVPGVGFDFGGVCKGMAVDRATVLLRAAKCEAALVQVGGETCCWGIAPAGRPHRIGIPHPDAPDDVDRCWARLQDPGNGMTGSTSGNYRQPIIIGGRTVYHIYDPRTGLPADTHVLSFSVVLPGIGHNGEADALTKSGILLGERGLELVRAAGGEAMLLRRKDGDDTAVVEVHTPGWPALLVPGSTGQERR